MQTKPEQIKSFFDLSNVPIIETPLKQQLQNADCGACVSFEGWVRNHHLGQAVTGLDYQAYPQLAIPTGQAIIADALQEFDIVQAICVHRYGALTIGDMAVWVGVASGHRDAAFAACRYILDRVKSEVPIWKQEYYLDKPETSWLANPEAEAYFKTNQS